MAAMNELPVVERYLDECDAIFSMIGGKYVISTPDALYEYDTYEEMVADIEATVREWDKAKSYKEYPTRYIGASDIASLTLRSPEGAAILNFGQDGGYQAYIVDEDAKIAEHYREVYSCKNWLKVYDDDTLASTFYGKEIKVYRAGEFGCIIQRIGRKEA